MPPEQRGLAPGLRTISGSDGHITSFALGGYVLEAISWCLVCLMGVPTGILSALLGCLVMQQRENRGEPVDYPGLLALAAVFIPLVLVSCC